MKNGGKNKSVAFIILFSVDKYVTLDHETSHKFFLLLLLRFIHNLKAE